MTYCVGLGLDAGIVLMADTRTNAGVDNVSTYKKMFTWETPGERVLTLMTAGNLGTTQAVVSILEERMKAPQDRSPSLLEVPSMFQAAKLVADTLRDVIAEHAEPGQGANGFGATLILAGQIEGIEPRIFMIYPEGNFVEACDDTPFFQIGETKYGRPILVRAYSPAMSIAEAIRLLIVSFDSTIQANLSVSPPLDVQVIKKDDLRVSNAFRIEADDPQFQAITNGWSEALRDALTTTPAFKIPAD